MKHFAWLVLIAAFAFLGCPNGSSSEQEIKTIEWEEDKDGFLQFYTNDSQYNLYIFLFTFENPGGQNVYEIECKKVSGSEHFGYGLVFAYSDTDMYKFFRLIITTDGSYKVLRQNGDYDTSIIDWKTSPELLIGNNKINKLKVVKAGSSYTVFINDIHVDQFTDSFAGGNRIGFYVAIGPEEHENFPDIPVDVRFRLPQSPSRSLELIEPSKAKAEKSLYSSSSPSISGSLSASTSASSVE